MALPVTIDDACGPMLRTTPRVVDNPMFLLFIGSERTGSTLLGQILNHHPSCLIANESRFLSRVLAEEASFEHLLSVVAHDAWRQYRVGLENDGRFRPTVGGSNQARWQSFHALTHDPAFQKRQIELAGDKKAGANTQAIIDAPGRCTELMVAHPEIRLLQIVRDPYDAARSSERFLGRTFEASCEQIVARTTHAHRWSRQFGARALHVHYEDLCVRPALEIGRILAWLGLESSPDWITRICPRVSTGDPQERGARQGAFAQRLIRSCAPGGPLERYAH